MVPEVVLITLRIATKLIMINLKVTSDQLAKIALDSQNSPSVHSSCVQNGPSVHLTCVKGNWSQGAILVRRYNGKLTQKENKF